MRPLDSAVAKAEHIVDHTCNIEDGSGQTIEVFFQKSSLRVEGHHVGSAQVSLQTGQVIQLENVTSVGGNGK